MKSLQRSALGQAGFTIIETMFVLAIAGLILLIVFEAMPALQRGSRNNQRKQDVATILRAVSQYELRDSGDFPLPCGSGAVGPINFTIGGAAAECDNAVGGAYPNDAFLRYTTGLTYYQASNIGLDSQTVSGRQSIATGVTDPEKVVVLNYERCTTPSGTATIQGAGYSDVVALYALEAANNGYVSQCQQL